MLSVCIVLAMCASYFAVAAFFAWLFEKPFPTFTHKSFFSVLLISVCVSAAYVIADVSANVELGNRLQHALGGGFAGVLVCFLSARDTQLRIGRLRFMAMALLMVTAMGVANELLEFILQTHSHYIFSDNPLDTWRDLASNTAGACVGLVILAPFVTSTEH